MIFFSVVCTRLFLKDADLGVVAEVKFELVNIYENVLDDRARCKDVVCSPEIIQMPTSYGR